jgi:dihydroorotate dehydrogenase electron transfer subunit
MIAGGVGLAPFVTLSEALQARGTKTRLFYGARTSSDLVHVDVFERLGVEPVLATEDGSRGTHGFVTAALDQALRSTPRTQDVRLYACGPTPMMHAVARLAAAHGRPCDVSLEQVMGCGLGGCYSCVVLTRTSGGAPHFVRSCIDGPVFDATRILWDALAH